MKLNLQPNLIFKDKTKKYSIQKKTRVILD